MSSLTAGHWYIRLLFTTGHLTRPLCEELRVQELYCAYLKTTYLVWHLVTSTFDCCSGLAIYQDHSTRTYESENSMRDSNQQRQPHQRHKCAKEARWQEAGKLTILEYEARSGARFNTLMHREFDQEQGQTDRRNRRHKHLC